jgi:phage terminase large subunit-like protein
MVWLSENTPWLADYETELVSFPAGRHDDQVDSTTQYLLWVQERPRSEFIVAWN